MSVNLEVPVLFSHLCLTQPIGVLHTMELKLRRVLGAKSPPPISQTKASSRHIIVIILGMIKCKCTRHFRLWRCDLA